MTVQAHLSRKIQLPKGKPRILARPPLKQIGDVEAALSLANDNNFGLSPYLRTADTRRIMRAGRTLNAKEVYGLDRYFKKHATYLNWAR